ncbi:hypothetical protein H0H92_003381 [Tricholoma furcatifolium]|nr:hypothetical protein H0H92_003381 [Tricholoma furcatifolium]
MTRRPGKSKARSYTPPPEPEPDTESEDAQLAEALHRASLESRLASTHEQRGQGTSQPPCTHFIIDDDDTVVVSSDESDVEIGGESSKISINAAEAQLRSTHQRSSKGKAFVVYKGRIPGVYQSWHACKDQVSGYSHNSYEGFGSLEEAQAAWDHSLIAHTTGPPGSSAAYLDSLLQPPQTPRKTQTPRTPASAARLAAISEGLKSRHAPSPTSALHACKPSQYPPMASSQAQDECSTKRMWRRTPEDAYSKHSTQVAQGVPNAESAWYTVIEGRQPGVYHSRSAATRAIGQGVTGRVHMSVMEEQANEKFVRAYMAHQVKRVE